MRALLILLLLLATIAGGVWFSAGRADGPVIAIEGSPLIGQIGDVTIVIDAPDGALTRIEVRLLQGGRVSKLFVARAGARANSIDVPKEIIPAAAVQPTDVMELTREGPDRVRLSRSLGKQTIPELKTGTAEIVVTAVRPVLFGMREATTTATREIEVRLAPPRLTVLSQHHYINHGGSEMVVYRVTPSDARSGVLVGKHEYAGFSAGGAGIDSGDPSLRVAFFALLPDQAADTPISVFARDSLGNEAAATFDYRVLAKEFRNSRIQVSDGFLSRVVPAILQNETARDTPDSSDLLTSYLWINRDLRQINNETIAALADQTTPEILWRGPFKQLMNSAVQGGFADQRTYLYHGRVVDEQVHLGFDLASTARASVRPANRGRVLHAGWLGIYGNCVIVDHGMGLQSLYAHLSTLSAQVGDIVELDTVLGRSGATGLAGGDHLHFTMLLGGNAVTPIDWWSKKWVEDRVIRKLDEAAGTSPN